MTPPKQNKRPMPMPLRPAAPPVQFARACRTAVLLVAVWVWWAAAASAAALEITDRSLTLALLSDTTVTLSGRAELHLTGTGDPMAGCVIHLNSPDAWLFLREIRPFTVNGSFLGRIRVNGVNANTATNVRVVQHGVGSVVIPHGPSIRPLTIHSERRFEGNSATLPLHTYHNNANLGALAGNVRSFRLKRGYMATMARNEDGTGPSRVFIAQDDDLDVTEMPAGLGHSVRFIRVFPWRWVAKKGWAGAGDNPAQVDAAWYYNWNNNENSFFNREYVPIRQTRWWPSYDVTNAKQNVTHLLGFNEPDNAVEADMTVAQAIAEWPNLMRSGLRLGSPAPTDGGLSWLYSFMDQADALGYRVDFVAVHFYRGGQTAEQLYQWLEQIHLRTGRPLWITEFNNGANWTCCAPTSYTQNGQIIKSFAERMDAAPFVERYAIYNWLNGNRELIVNGNLTAAGVVYRDHKSPIGFRDAPPQRLVAVYDEQTDQPNSVNHEMPYSDNTTWTTGIGRTLGAAQVIPLATFRSRLASAAANGFGGVVDFERGALHGGVTSNGQGFTAMFDGGRKSLDFTNRSGNGGNYSINRGLNTRTAVSGERYLSRSGTPNFDFDLRNTRGFIRNERVVAAGTTVLGRNGVAGTNHFRFTAWYTNGSENGSTSVRRQVNTNTGNGTADTFSGIAAPPGYWITRVAVTSENGAYTSIDDLAFITSLDPELLWMPAGTTGGSGIWDASTAAWTNGEQVLPWPGGRTATFAGSPGTVHVTGAVTGVDGLVFESSGYTLAGAGSLAFSPGASVDVSASLATIHTPLAGERPAKTGPGTLVLGAANPFDPGTWTFGSNHTNAGYLRLTHPGAMGNTGLIRLRGSQGIAVSGIELAGSHTFDQAIETWGRSDPDTTGHSIRNLSGNNAWLGDITIVEGGGSYGFISDAGRLTLGGRITSTFAHATFGNRGVSFNGAGEIRINGRLVNGNGPHASLRLAITKNGPGRLSFGAGSELEVASFTFNAGSLALDSPASLAAGTFTLNALMPVTVTGEATFAFPLGGDGSIVKSGPGTLTLAAANSFGPDDGTLTLGSGATQAGTLRLTHPQALGKHRNVVLASGQSGTSGIELSGGHVFSAALETVGRADAAGAGFALRNVTGDNTWDGPLTITAGGGSYGIVCDAGSLTLDGDLSSSVASSQFGARAIQFAGAGDFIVNGRLRKGGNFAMQELAVTISGPGTVTLAAGGDYSGPTTVEAGTLRVDGTLDASPVTVAPGATLTGSGTLASAAVQGTLALEIGQTLTIAGALELDDATLEITGSPPGDGPVVLCYYGNSIGSFAVVSGLPEGWALDAGHAGGTALAMVRGGYAAWSASHLGGGGADEDFAGSGIPNLLRYALLMDPASAGLPGRLEGGSVSFSKRPEAVAGGDVVYVIETSPDLSAGSWRPVAAGIDDDSTISFELPPGHGKVFVRLKVSLRAP